jgi:hypothetical protein
MSAFLGTLAAILLGANIVALVSVSAHAALLQVNWS